ncbi:LuxR C-terminal-related transcriptional regulator [Lewinella sp. IMCC34191]|uniref:LuxR C-terminal-related transcriptional regulator n=1 Tax=Lewinella sp. IMCC34191 TaxID=2259172 RepID=UPI000E285B1E|nr:LuxR C-terminal-related transcriptional regulator [Lewinella sp. IMCC34191]
MTSPLVSPKRLATDGPSHSYVPALTPDPAIESLIAQTNIYWYSVNYQTGRFRYVSPGITSLLGYDPGVWKFGGPSRAFDYIHPEDQPCVKRILAEIRRELSRHPIGKRKALSFGFTCRFRDAKGQYLHLNHQLTFPNLDVAGLPVTDFTVVTDISALQSPHACQLHVRHTSFGKTETLHTRVFNCKDSVNFSRREMDVLKLVAEGCSSQEIGERLFISYNTVCTHRKNLMKKAGVRGTVDLLRFARSLGIIK